MKYTGHGRKNYVVDRKLTADSYPQSSLPMHINDAVKGEKHFKELGYHYALARKVDDVVLNASRAILQAAKRNPNITVDGLQNELENAMIGGWLGLAAVRQCALYQWSEAMDLAIRTLRAK
jgi:hypothetical protein